MKKKKKKYLWKHIKTRLVICYEALFPEQAKKDSFGYTFYPSQMAS
jgi:apolipoprotein N-acyltransferase